MTELRTTYDVPTLRHAEERADGSGALVAEGYGVVYGKRSRDLGGFVEEVRYGSAAKTVQEADVRALVNHDPSMLLGRTGAGTLRLEDREAGLFYSIDLPDTTLGRDTAKLLERGDYPGSSFGFRALGDEWTETEDGRPLRILTEFALRDVGPVAFPAYDDSTTGLASLAAKRSMDLAEVRALADEGNLIEAVRHVVPTEDEDEGRCEAPSTLWVPKRYF